MPAQPRRNEIKTEKDLPTCAATAEKLPDLKATCSTPNPVEVFYTGDQHFLASNSPILVETVKAATKR